MGFKDVLKKISQGGNEPDEYGYGYDEDIDGAAEDYVEEPEQETIEETFAPRHQETYAPARPQNMNISGNAIELKVVKPESYKNASQIADHLLNGRTVVLNLESTNKETARRLIDFLTGAAYAIGGDIKKVSNNTYVITPGDSVAVSGDQMKTEEKAAPAEESAEYFEL